MADADERAKMYKNVAKGEADSSRRRRTEATIQLRREKRGNELNKRRNIDAQADFESEASDYDSKPPFKCTIAEARQMLCSGPTPETLRTVFEFLRKVLSRTQQPPIDEIVKEGLVQAFVQALGVDDPKVQYEAAWALTNIVSGTSQHTQEAVKCGATPAFIKLAYSDDESLAEQCFWGLANIIGDCAELRDHAIQCGFLELFNHYIAKLKNLRLAFVKTLAWVCSNLCRHKHPQLTKEQIASLMPTVQILVKHAEESVRQDTCWALSYLTDGDDEILHIVLKADILPAVRLLLASNSPSMIAPALRVFGNFVSGSDVITQSVINMGILNNEISKALCCTASSVVKEACWMLSNVLAGTENQIQAVINSGVLPRVLEVLRHGDFKVQSEAAWAVSNLYHSGNKQQGYYLAEVGVLDAIVPLMNVRHVEFTINLLSTLQGALDAVTVLHPEQLEDYKLHFEEIGGVDFLEDLQNHENPQIYEKSYEIIQNWFNDEDDGENADPMGQHHPGPKGDSADVSPDKPVFRF